MVKKYLRDNKGRFISSKTQQSKTQPSKTQPSKRDSKGRFISSKTQPSKTQPSKTQPSKTQPSKTQPSKTQPSKTKKTQKKKKNIASTSKTQQTQVKTQNKNIKIFTQNFTFDFKPKLDTKAFKQKISYLIYRILSQFRKFSFSTKTISNIKSSTIFKDRRGNSFSNGHNSSNQICKNINELKLNLEYFFELITQTTITSLCFIEFIDLTITLYKF